MQSQAEQRPVLPSFPMMAYLSFPLFSKLNCPLPPSSLYWTQKDQGRWVPTFTIHKAGINQEGQDGGRIGWLVFKAKEVLGWNNTVHGTTDTKALHRKSCHVNRRIAVLTPSSWWCDWWISIPSNAVLEILTMHVRHCTRHRPGICSLKQPSIRGLGVSSFALSQSRIPTTLQPFSTCTPSGRRPVWPNHRKGDPATPGVLHTLWTQNSSPFPSKTVYPSDKLVQGKASLWVSFWAAWQRQCLSSALMHGFINQSERRFHLHLRDMELLPRSRGSLNWKKASPPTLSFTTESRTILPI